MYLCSDCHTATESTPHTVTWNEVEGVKLTLGTTNKTYIKDDTVTLTVEKEGTDIVTVTAKNGDTDVALTEVQEAAQDEAAAQATTEKAKTVYTFTMPDGDVTISVTKAAKTYAVKVADANKDTLKITSPEADLNKVTAGTTITVVATPKDGYTLTADGVVVTYGDNQTLKATPDTEKANTYTFAMPAGDATVSAEFEEVKKYTVTVDPVEGEAAEVTATPKEAAKDAEITVEVKNIKDGYKLKDDGLTYSYKDGERPRPKTLTLTEARLPFKMPAANVTVSAAFEAVEVKTYSVAVDKKGEGAVEVTANDAAVTETTALKAGDIVTFTVTPKNEATILTKLAENGLSVKDSKGTAVDYKAGTTDGTYTFEMPADNVTISVQFTTVEYSIVTTADPAEGGTITVTVNGKSELKRAPKGAEMAVTVTPNSGYELEQASHGQTVITDKSKMVVRIRLP